MAWRSFLIHSSSSSSTGRDKPAVRECDEKDKRSSKSITKAFAGIREAGIYGKVVLTE
jgi:hypothetical protein